MLKVQSDELWVQKHMHLGGIAEQYSLTQQPAETGETILKECEEPDHEPS